ncbi:MAG: hypothetical protein WDM96_18250 [Lacunisphaera sp.]
MTSTPSVIQFSTISFCFAALLSVGPSNSSSTPSSFAALSAPVLAGDEVGVALGLRQHADHELAVGSGKRGAGREQSSDSEENKRAERFHGVGGRKLVVIHCRLLGPRQTVRQ